MNMIEKVAKAMHEDCNWCSWDALPDECSSYGVGKNERKRAARVAIEAMWDLDQDMIMAGIDAGDTSIEKTYRAMIDKALEEE